MCWERQELIKMKVEKLVRRNHMAAVQKSSHLSVFKQGNGKLLTLLTAFTEGFLRFALHTRKLSQRD